MENYKVGVSIVFFDADDVDSKVSVQDYTIVEDVDRALDLMEEVKDFAAKVFKGCNMSSEWETKDEYVANYISSSTKLYEGTIRIFKSKDLDATLYSVLGIYE